MDAFPRRSPEAPGKLAAEDEVALIITLELGPVQMVLFALTVICCC